MMESTADYLRELAQVESSSARRLNLLEIADEYDAMHALAKTAEPIVAWGDELIEIECNWFVQNGKTKVTVEHFRALAAAYRKALGET